MFLIRRKKRRQNVARRQEGGSHITMESSCSTSDFDTPNYPYVAAPMGNHEAAVIARRVRERFSVTRLLSRSVRFYFALSRGESYSFLPSFHPALPCPLRRRRHILLSYSPLIHLSWLSRRLGRAYFSPSRRPLALFFYSFVFLPFWSQSRLPLGSPSHVTTPRPYPSALTPYFRPLHPHVRSS